MKFVVVGICGLKLSEPTIKYLVSYLFLVWKYRSLKLKQYFIALPQDINSDIDNAGRKSHIVDEMQNNERTK